MRIGLDFGTTNSGAAVFDGRRVHVFPLDRSAEPFDSAQDRRSRQSPASHDPTVIRSTLYITRDHEYFIGREAVETYYRQNVGRPSKMVRQYVGEIEVTAADMSFIRDVYVMVDELTPGRLLRSLKSGLATPYEGTTIFGRYYELEELIALYLREIRERVEAETGQAVEGLVLGRPVNFGGSGAKADPQARGPLSLGQRTGGNQRAEDRLRRAAQEAGFQEITFELEPVAAALHYELMTGQPQNIVVFDFGGGTLDITVMRVGEPGRREVFATGGVGIAGDVFDQRIIEALLLDHFGRGSTVRLGPSAGLRTGPSTLRQSSGQAPLRARTELAEVTGPSAGLRTGPSAGLRTGPSADPVPSKNGGAQGEGATPFPSQYIHALVNWQALPELNRPETLHFFHLAQINGSHPARVRALESLVVNNYAMRMFDQVEGAKIALSEARFALVRVGGEDIDVWQPLTRSQFESLIADETHRIEACLLDTLDRSGLSPAEIDAAVRTGGSAQIPRFIDMLGRIFGPEKVVLSDVFSGVTAGLAIRAQAGW